MADENITVYLLVKVNGLGKKRVRKRESCAVGGDGKNYNYISSLGIIAAGDVYTLS